MVSVRADAPERRTQHMSAMESLIRSDRRLGQPNKWVVKLFRSWIRRSSFNPCIHDGKTMVVVWSGGTRDKISSTRGHIAVKRVLLRR
jgi:hypothetical protein